METRHNEINVPNEFFPLEFAALTIAFTLTLISYRYSKLQKEMHALTIKKNAEDYTRWKKITSDIPLPAAFVDLDAYEENLKKLVTVVANHNANNATTSEPQKTIRLATKSIRTPYLIKKALKMGAPLIQGLMCYSAEEAQFLWTHGIGNDFLIPYPIGDKFALSILHDMHVSGAKISLVVHSVDHLTKLSDTMHDVMTPFPVIIEVDTSIRFWDGYIHLGARRSPIHTLDQLRQILKVSKTFKNIQVIGAMVYESAVAGLRDNDPYAGFMMNSIAWIVRKASAAHTAKICADIPTIFAEEGVKLNLFNGGGTGSISTTVGNKGLTEVTFGSGLLDPALFVNQYSNLNTLGLKPAIYFAIPVCTTDKGYVTCFQGGYVASGNISKAKQPIVISPAGLNNLDSEGWGEATTPFAAPENIKLTSGDPVICQPAKSGEISEFFNTLNCFRFFKHPANTPENQVKNKNKKEDQQAIERIVKTYRGYGHRF